MMDAAAADAATGERTAWRPSRDLTVAALVVAIMGAPGIIAGLLPANGAANVLIGCVAFVAAMAVAASRGRGPLRLVRARARARDHVIAAGMLVLAVITNEALVFALTTNLGITGGHGGGWLEAVDAVLLGPVEEEFVFRGVVLTRLSRAGGSVRLGAMVSALAFALLHPDANLVPALVGALFLTLARVRGGLGWAVLVHAAVNGAVMLR